MNEENDSIICSTIIPTIGRQSLTRAVRSVLEQDFPQSKFEVIVVNDSGIPLALEKWMKSPQVRIIHTNCHNRSVARNTGAAIARGKYLHFLDDDDWMLPNAFKHIWQQTENDGQAGWVYGGFRIVDNDGETVKNILPMENGNCYIQLIAAEWIPIQASWIKTGAFFKAGGFASLKSLEGGYEDIDLSRLVSRYYDFSRSSELVAAIRYGDVGSTTNYTKSVVQNRLSREKTLEITGSFSRMRTSVQGNNIHKNYWRGRIIYYYLVSIFWNLKHKYLFKAISRLMFALLAFAISVPYVFSKNFWRGILLPHHNLVRNSLGDLESKLYTQTVWER